jgi:hypothetical protein
VSFNFEANRLPEAHLFVWTGEQPVAVAVLSPEPADFASGIYDVFMGLHRIAAPPAEASP